MATPTELHRESKSAVREALIKGNVDLTEHGSVVARIEAHQPREKMTRDEVLLAIRQSKTKFNLTWEAIRATIRQ